MARETAIKTLVIVLIYFVALSLIFTGMAAVQNLFGFDSGGVTRDDDSYIVNTCVEPRFGYDLLKQESFGLRSTNDKCSKLGLSEVDCPTVNGCAWETTTYWFIGESQFCDGNINVSYYDGVSGTNICTGLSHTQATCEIMGCTWIGEEGALNNINNVNPDGFISLTGGFSGLKTFWKTLSQAFTLRLDFTTENSLINTTLQFFMLLLPLIIMIGSVIVLILG